MAVTLSLPDRQLNIEPNEYISPVDPLPPPKGVPRELFRVVTIDLRKYSTIFLGQAFLMFVSNAENTLFDVHYNNLLLSLEQNSLKDRIPIPLQLIFRNFTGNRVTIGGFRMQFPGLSKLLRQGKTIIPVVFDVDIIPVSMSNLTWQEHASLMKT